MHQDFSKPKYNPNLKNPPRPRSHILTLLAKFARHG